ncbi:hypothetical protein [Mycolicibacterium fortuitum]|uniref:Uncharacterized protein n=3 Tax=Mycolicibacterium TaxID=1866885 RepID=A0AAE5AH65_MYCFO|nr:hypothetical protein [Mycolicibacterium fortuitum]STZ41315.1 Uncharacterised protein [Mycolicibacterium gilvum]GAT11243.1 transcriptional regulator [Mycolicibacterium novocastrense]MDV7195740.1 hypothetical protein [Mycolicibacterium fortuitum]MDV7209448.1 hypothetical protein [Mycolicibacterium fortuitum]MDV7231308.1 hypothetical protein [Mycolicibacterium fortuitum]
MLWPWATGALAEIATETLNAITLRTRTGATAEVLDRLIEATVDAVRVPRTGGG